MVVDSTSETPGRIHPSSSSSNSIVECDVDDDWESPPSSDTDRRGLKKSRSGLLKVELDAEGEHEALERGLWPTLLHLPLTSWLLEDRKRSTIVRVLEDLRWRRGLAKNDGKRVEEGLWELLADPRGYGVGEPL
jgi:hypothetical protein